MAEERVLAQFPGADEPAVQELLRKATRESRPPGDVILREGDPADALYVVVRGEARVSREREEGDPSQFLARLVEGQLFGEIGLLQDRPRTATVRAGPHGVDLLRLDRDSAKALLGASDLVFGEIAGLLRKRLAAGHLLAALPGLKAGGATRWLPEFSERTCAQGEVLIREGDAATEFFVLTSGEVSVLHEAEEREVARLSPGSYFGEIGLLRGTPRSATVKVVSDSATVLALDAAGFQRLVAEAGGSRGELATALLRRMQ